MCECGRARLRAPRRYFVFIIRVLLPTGALSHAILVSDFQDSCYHCSRFPKRPRAAGSEAGMDCGTALAKQARHHPCGEALRRRVVARPRAPAPAAEGRVGEKSGSQSSQFGFARKPLNSLDSRKKEAWNSLPLALNFLPNDL